MQGRQKREVKENVKGEGWGGVDGEGGGGEVGPRAAGSSNTRRQHW